MIPRLSRSVLLLTAALWLGCTDGSPIEADPEPATIVIRPGGPLTVRAGDVVPLLVTVLDRNGTALPAPGLTFTSSDPGIVTVAPTGGENYALTAGTSGTATLTARTADASTRYTVHVLAWPRTTLGGAAFGAAARGGTALVATLDGALFRLDPASGAVVATYDYPSDYVAFSDDGARAFVANTVLDLAAGSAVRPLLTDQFATCGDIYAARERRGGGIVYLGCTVGVLAVNPATSGVLTTFPTAGPVNGLALHPTEPRLYASAPSADRVYEISTQSNFLIRELPILGGPQGVVLPGGSELEVAIEGDKQVERWDLDGPQPTDSVRLSPLSNTPGPFDLVLSEDGRRLLASVGSVVIELDRATLAVTTSYWVGGRARRIGVTQGRAVVANEGGWVDLLPF